MRRVELWHPDSPGVRVRVFVRWPRSLFVHGPKEGQPVSFATLTEALREDERRKDAEAFGRAFPPSDRRLALGGTFQRTRGVLHREGI